jgi:hypothetical protein
MEPLSYGEYNGPNSVFKVNIRGDDVPPGQNCIKCCIALFVTWSIILFIMSIYDDNAFTANAMKRASPSRHIP